MSSSNKVAPLYSIWRSKTTKKQHVVLGFCIMPELQQHGIILSGDNNITVTPGFLIDKFEKTQ